MWNDDNKRKNHKSRDELIDSKPESGAAFPTPPPVGSQYRPVEGSRRDELVGRVAAPKDTRALSAVDPVEVTLGDPPKTLHRVPGFGPTGIGATKFGRDHHHGEQGKPDRRAAPKTAPPAPEDEQ
jgi:hypothetical protein